MKKIKWLNIKGVILDMDGVVYRGDTAIKSAIKSINIWKNKNIKICFLTNNSTKNQYGFSKKLRLMGLNVNKQSIITTSLFAADYLEKNYKKNNRVYVVGSSSLKDIISKRGFIRDDENASIVIVGLDEKFTYKKLKLASELLRKGAKLIATNSDKLYPINKGFKPGAGSIVQFIRSASNNVNCLFLGKPNPLFVNKAINYLNLDKSEVLLIGDQLETDILGANKAQILSVLVTTGIKNINKKIKPTFIINSLLELPISTK